MHHHLVQGGVLVVVLQKNALPVPGGNLPPDLDEGGNLCRGLRGGFRLLGGSGGDAQGGGQCRQGQPYRKQLFHKPFLRFVPCVMGSVYHSLPAWTRDSSSGTSDGSGAASDAEGSFVSNTISGPVCAGSPPQALRVPSTSPERKIPQSIQINCFMASLLSCVISMVPIIDDGEGTFVPNFSEIFAKFSL